MTALLAIAALAQAAPVTYRGAVAAESRLYAAPPQSVTQFPGPTVSLMADPTFQHRAGPALTTVEPFLRMDSHDRDRTHADLRRADVVASAGWGTGGAGVAPLRWGVLTGGARIADVLSQPDQVEGPATTARLGQPYASLAVGPPALRLEGLVAPYTRSRTFPGLTGRMRPGYGVDRGDPQFAGRFGPWTPSGAARVALSAGPLDLRVAGFRGTSRDPRFVAQLTDPRPALAYDPLEQVALDGALVVGPAVVRAEGALRRYRTGEDRIGSAAAGVGVELTKYGLVKTADLTLLVEAVRDDRPVGAPVTFVDHDVFAALRLAANDPAGSELLAGALVDVVTGFTSVRGTVQRRLDDHWKATVSATVFAGPTRDVLEWWLLGEDHVELQLAYHL
ncbi:MAG: hypothetical protein R3F59_26770 [Myxococcota bacterium]